MFHFTGANGALQINEKEWIVFVELSDESFPIKNQDKVTQFVLVDEIMNTKHVCDMKIDKKVSNFFYSYSDFLFLQDKKTNQPIETPVVVYVGSHESMLEFTYVFGVVKTQNILGSYYYFTDYANAMNQVQQIKGKKGIIRFAIFVGKMLVKWNDKNEPIDNSEMKRKQIQINPLKETLFEGITDYEGNWSKNNDSVYVGNIQLYDGITFANTPIIVVKDITQQVSLSFHYV